MRASYFSGYSREAARTRVEPPIVRHLSGICPVPKSTRNRRLSASCPLSVRLHSENINWSSGLGNPEIGKTAICPPPVRQLSAVCPLWALSKSIAVFEVLTIFIGPARNAGFSPCFFGRPDAVFANLWLSEKIL